MVRASLLIAAALGTAGCFSSSTIVKVRPDGSGTIEVTSALRKAALVQLDVLADADAANRRAPRLDEWFPEHRARFSASSLGPDVRFVSSKAIDNDELLGRVTRYEFTDLRRVTLEPIAVFPAVSTFGGGARLAGEHRFTFDLIEQETGLVIVVRLPDARIEYDGLHESLQPDQTSDPKELAFVRSVVSGGRLEVAVEPELPVIRTNTPHVNGQRVTLVSLPAEPLFLDDTIATRLLSQPGSLDELRYRLHDAPGVMVSLDSEIRIELARP